MPDSLSIVVCNESLLEQPKDILPLSNYDELTVGDLHGNALKFIHFLIKQGVLQLSKPWHYQRLEELYLSQSRKLRLHYLERRKPFKAFTGPPQNGLITKEELSEFYSILDRATFKKPALIRLIGDELADRGHNDIFTLLILKVLIEKEIPVKICLSNHGLIAVMTLLNLVRSNQIPAYQTTLLPGQDKSLTSLLELIKNNIVTISEIRDLFENYYFKCLCYVDYSTDAENNLFIYTHAPSDLVSIKSAFRAISDSAAYHLNKRITLRFNTQLDLIQSITKVNAVVLKLLRMRRFYLFQYSNHNPIANLYWARGLYRYYRFQLTSGELIFNIHGHVGELTQELHPIHCTNLDTNLGRPKEYSETGEFINEVNVGTYKTIIQPQVNNHVFLQTQIRSRLLQLTKLKNDAQKKYPKNILYLLEAIEVYFKENLQQIDTLNLFLRVISTLCLLYKHFNFSQFLVLNSIIKGEKLNSLTEVTNILELYFTNFTTFKNLLDNIPLNNVSPIDGYRFSSPSLKMFIVALRNSYYKECEKSIPSMEQLTLLIQTLEAALEFAHAFNEESLIALKQYKETVAIEFPKHNRLNQQFENLINDATDTLDFIAKESKGNLFYPQEKEFAKLYRLAKNIFLTLPFSDQQFIKLIHDYWISLKKDNKIQVFDLHKLYLERGEFLNLLREKLTEIDAYQPELTHLSKANFLILVCKNLNDVSNYIDSSNLGETLQNKLFITTLNSYQQLSAAQKSPYMSDLIRVTESLYTNTSEQNLRENCYSAESIRSFDEIKHKSHLIVSLKSITDAYRKQSANFSLITEALMFWDEQGEYNYQASFSSCQRLIRKTLSSLSRHFSHQPTTQDYLDPIGLNRHGFWQRKPLTSLLIKAHKEINKSKCSMT